ncbi:MAG TPA: sigma-E factor regulatory protein RseB domain-containing protein [Roseiflexaceae bacterium]|nr:sigma-E factor regulatory protein RseB domain-containing protein [Roseiflexaceae bacterium]
MNQDQHIHRLLSDIAEAEVPDGSLDLAARVRQQARAPRSERVEAPRARRQGLFRPALAGLCLLAVLALGLSLLPGQTASVSAQEALKRAEQQASAFGLSGVRSLHGVMETIAPGSGTVVREEIWVELPGRLRKETIWPPTRQNGAEFQTMLTDGSGAWIWSVPAATPDAPPDSIGLIDQAELDTALYTIPTPHTSLDPSGQPPAGLCAQPGDQLVMQGEETVLGRTALVVDCRIAPSDNDPGSHLKFWIDKELFVVLRFDYFETNGDLFVRSQFTQFEVDPAIPAERFTFAPPAGVPIEDYRTGAPAR